VSVPAPAGVSAVLRARSRAEEPDQAAVWLHLATAEEVHDRVEELEAHAAAHGSLALHGVPFAVKDNIDVAGWPTTAGCPAYRYVAKRSASAVQRLIAAGAVCIGKTNLDQFATGLVGTRSPFGVPRNARDPRLVPGGSSSGSAIAVARGVVPFALGTDTAGSGRVPAALNGILGVKPTRGLVPTSGVVPACRSLDCVSVFARELDLARIVLTIMAGPDPRDPFSRRAPADWRSTAPGKPGPWRVGIPTLTGEDFAGDEQAQSAFDASVSRLVDRTVEAVPVEISALRRAGELLYGGPWVAERAAAVGDFVRSHPGDVLPVTAEIILGGDRVSAVAAFEACYELQVLRRRTYKLLANLDAIVLPTIPTFVTLEQDAADPLGPNALLGRFTHAVNLLDLAAIAVPGCDRADGGPAGISLIGPAFRDGALLSLAEELDAPAPSPWRASAPRSPPERVDLFVLGAHMSGMPLEQELRRLGATPKQPVRTAGGYRLLALEHLRPTRPGLVADPAGAGGVAGELWTLSPAALGALAAMLSEPLSLGPVRLCDDRVVVGFLCSAAQVPRAPDITSIGGWRAYVERSTPDGG
jgi:allophanate hydrolase